MDTEIKIVSKGYGLPADPKKNPTHVIRHTFATPLLDKGNDLKTVQPLMGHSHIRTTEAYLHSTDDRKVEAIRSLSFGV
jgi:integrase/recombinase XerD